MTIEKRVKKRFNTKRDDLSKIIEFVHDFMESCFVGCKHRKHIELAIEEMAINVIHYAYNDKVGPLDIELIQEDPEHLVVEMTDWGEKFDPTRSFGRQDTEGEDIQNLKEGGLGIYLTNQVMDDIVYERLGTENHLIMRKAI